MRRRTIAGLFLMTLAACTKAAPEPGSNSESVKPAVQATAYEKTAQAAPLAAPAAVPVPGGAPASTGNGSVVQKGGGDPLNGKWTLAQATADIKGGGALIATIDTANGALACKLFEDKAPITVANFVGLARGTRPWKDPLTGDWVKRPAYDGTTFHRIIRGFMIQGGDPKGNGSGEPGYVIPDEIWAGAKHDRAGLLCMANRGPNTNGAQFFITDAPAAHLDNNYTIFGECSPVETVHAIAATPTTGDRPPSPPAIKKVTIAREKP